MRREKRDAPRAQARIFWRDSLSIAELSTEDSALGAEPAEQMGAYVVESAADSKQTRRAQGGQRQPARSERASADGGCAFACSDVHGETGDASGGPSQVRGFCRSWLDSITRRWLPSLCL